MAIKLDIEVGDIVLTGKFKNKRTVVKEIGTDELGQPTINGKPILKLRIEKLLPKEKQSKETREGLEEMTEFSEKRFKKLAGLLKEQFEPEDEEQAFEMIDALITDVIDGKKQPEEALAEIQQIKARFELDQVDIQMFIEGGDYAQAAARAAYKRVNDLMLKVSRGVKK